MRGAGKTRFSCDFVVGLFGCSKYSLSLSLIGAPPLTPYTNILLYARVKNGANPLGKGLARDSVACFVVSVGQVTANGYKLHFASFFRNKPEL